MKLNLKIMKTRPEVSDEELRGYMDFDALLERRRIALRKTGRFNMLRNGAILTATVLLLSIVWYTHRGDPAGTREQQTPPQESLTTERQPAPTPLTDTAMVPKETETATDANRTSEKSTIIPQQQETPTSKPLDEKQAPEPAAKDDTGYVYTEATPIDGFPALYEYFERELVYPASAIPDSIQGVVTVNFVIGTTGAPEDIRIQNSLGPAFDDEVNRLIRNMPAWEPAALNGQPVPSKLAIPITFRLEKIR